MTGRPFFFSSILRAYTFSEEANNKMSLSFPSLCVMLIVHVAFVVGDIQFIYPKAQSIVRGDKPFNVTFIDNGSRPRLTELSSYIIHIYSEPSHTPVLHSAFPSAAGNFNLKRILQTSTLSPINLDGRIGPNLFYLSITSTFKSNSSISVTNYSERFTIRGRDVKATGISSARSPVALEAARPQRSFSCNGSPCIPSFVKVKTRRANNCNPRIATVTALPTPSKDSGLGTYIGVIIFLSVLVIITMTSAIIVLRLRKRKARPAATTNTSTSSSGSSWWNNSASSLSLIVQPLNMIKDQNKKEANYASYAARRRTYDLARLSRLEISRPKNVYGGPAGLSGGQGDFKEKDQKRDSLSTIEERSRDGGDEASKPGREKREARFFDERTRSRYYRTDFI
ncbi:hypothetical protein B0O99DRAFT_228978 [Bisporella sp. PMI_857]|nr:hypothetical protein B0O99DRAFT_228978 [Bisporella sp. PMI_857]